MFIDSGSPKAVMPSSKESKHCVLRFYIGIGREIARSFIETLQRCPETTAHNRRTFPGNRNRYVKVVHTWLKFAYTSIL
jgi:hypothetical protein